MLNKTTTHRLPGLGAVPLPGDDPGVDVPLDVEPEVVAREHRRVRLVVRVQDHVRLQRGGWMEVGRIVKILL